jgi:hypothetical protein
VEEDVRAIRSAGVGVVLAGPLSLAHVRGCEGNAGKEKRFSDFRWPVLDRPVCCGSVGAAGSGR